MVIQFLNKLRVDLINDKPTWQLVDEFRIMVDDEPVTVPIGFVTDFGSVPRLPLVYLIGGNRGIAACVLHDYLYTIKTHDRKFCDLVLLNALAADGVGFFTRWGMYRAVRLFGGSHYD